MLFKEVNVHLEDSIFQISQNIGTSLITIRVSSMALDPESSSKGNEVYKEKEVVEVYLDEDEIDEVIHALKQIKPRRKER